MTLPTSAVQAVPPILEANSPRLIASRPITSKPVPIARHSADDVSDHLWSASPPTLTTGSSTMSHHIDYLATPAYPQPLPPTHAQPTASSSRTFVKPSSPVPDLRSESNFSNDIPSQLTPGPQRPRTFNSPAPSQSDLNTWHQERGSGVQPEWQDVGMARRGEDQSSSMLSSGALAGLEPISSRSPVSVDDWRRHVTPTPGLPLPRPTYRASEPAILTRPGLGSNTDARALDRSVNTFDRYRGPLTELGMFQPTFHPSARHPRSEFAVTDTASSDSASDGAGDAMSVDPPRTTLSGQPSLPGPGLTQPTQLATQGLVTVAVGDDFHRRSTALGLDAFNGRADTASTRDDHFYPLSSAGSRWPNVSHVIQPSPFWAMGRPVDFAQPRSWDPYSADPGSSSARAREATVPPPRPALNDPLGDWSPPRTDHLLVGHHPSTSPMQRSTSIGTAFRARRHAERLQRLDALRDGASQIALSARHGRRAAAERMEDAEEADRSTVGPSAEAVRSRTPSRDLPTTSRIQHSPLGAQRSHGAAPYSSSPPSRFRYQQSLRQATLARLNSDAESSVNAGDGAGPSNRQRGQAHAPPLPGLASFSWQTGDRPSTISLMRWPRRNSILEQGLDDLDAQEADLVDMGVRPSADTASGYDSEDTAYHPLAAALFPDNREMPNLAVWRAAMQARGASTSVASEIGNVLDAAESARRGRQEDLGGAALLRIVERFAFKADTPVAEQMEAIRTVIRFTGRWPAMAKMEGAEHQLKRCQWSIADHNRDLVKDSFCSVCHDEYEPNTRVVITPCKHMFHSDCLDTWFKTARVVSCPMCRRDLFLLECLTRLVPEKTLQAAMDVWITLQV